MKIDMKRIIRKILILIPIVILFVNTNAQNKNSIIKEKEVQDDKYIAQVIESLDEINPLRLALEEGRRGDAIHYGWMDEMKKLEVKHVSYAISFEWKKYKIRSVMIKKKSYHPLYYVYNSVIKDSNVLRQIKESGLEKRLESKALSMARDEVLEIIKEDKSSQGCGTLYVDLLDDERLPVITTTMTTVNYKCSKSKNSKID